MVRLNGLEKSIESLARIYAKLESKNPFGSIKDRAAKIVIEEAEKNGLMSKATCILEATSGNMGIALAGICQIKGYKCIIIMPENMSCQRKKLIADLGGELITTPAELGMTGSLEKANELKTQYENIYYADQFHNIACVNAHKDYTSNEIYKQLDGKVDVIIAGIGTGATIRGLIEFFNPIIPNIDIVGVLPSNNPHTIQGIGPGFIPPFLKNNIPKRIVTVNDDEAYEEKTNIFHSDGLSVGISSGATIAGLKKLLISNNYTNKNIVVIFPDGSDRYD